jgi:hypothetical protein
MSKSIYIFIFLALLVNFWDLIILLPIFNSTSTPIYIIIWFILGIVFFQRSRNRINIKAHFNYTKYALLLFAGFLLSLLPSYYFWHQDVLTSIITNRILIGYLFLPSLFYLRPTDKEIVKAVSYYAIVYLALYTIQAITLHPITVEWESKSAEGIINFDTAKSTFGYLLPGYAILLFLLYYSIDKFARRTSLKNILLMSLMLFVFIVLQNRGTLFFAVIVFLYAILRHLSKNRIITFIFFTIIVLLVFFITTSYWSSMLSRTTIDIKNPDYARWRAFFFFLFDYSPNWLCNILGNGFLSTKSSGGMFIKNLKSIGLYQSDLGLIGLWSWYGIIPLIVIYVLVIKTLTKKSFPFFLKAIAAHILIIPVCWSFNSYDIGVLCIFIYLIGYYTSTLSFRSPDFHSVTNNHARVKIQE